MRLHIISDLHMEFEPYERAEAAADAVVAAGDICTGLAGVRWLREQFPDRPVFYVLGNHEFYGQATPRLVGKIREEAEGTSVRLLDNEAAELDGIAFLGATLWTDFKLHHHDPRVDGLEVQRLMNDYRRIRVGPRYRKLRAADTATFHATSLRWLTQALADHAGKTRVVITHHAPSRRSLPDPSTTHPAAAGYASDLEELVAKSGAALWVHGHIHRAVDYTLGGTRVLSNPRGYPSERECGFKPDLVVEV